MYYNKTTRGGRELTRRDLVRKLEAAGYKLARKGGHAIYEKDAARPVQVPNHRELNEYTARAILKAAGIAE
jgi:mRNA interferase HicA